MEIVTSTDQLNSTSLIRSIEVSRLIDQSGTILTLVENRRVFKEKGADSDDDEAWVVFRDKDNQIRVALLIEFVVNYELSDSVLLDDSKIAAFVKAGSQIKQPDEDF